MRNSTSPTRPAPAGPPYAGDRPATSRQRTLLLVLSAAMLIDALEVSIVVVALPSIGGGLRIPASVAQWLMSGFALGFAGMLLFGGRVVDQLGQRRAYLVALLCYAAMCVVSGLAPDAGVLIAARVARGCCAALTAPAGLAIIARTFPEGGARNRALATYAAFGASGFTAGLLVSGLLTDVAWRWTLMCPAPIAFILAMVGWRVIPRAQSGQGPGRGVWPERLRLLARGTLARAGLAAAALNGSYWGLLLVATFWLQDGLGWRPLPTALAFLPASVPPMLAAPFAKSLVHRFGAQRLVVAGLLAATCGYAVALAGAPKSYVGGLLPALLLVGLGYVGAFSALHVYALSDVPADAARLATGIYQSLVQIGGALVLVVVGAVLAVHELPGQVGTAHAIAASYRSVAAVATVVSALGVAAVVVARVFPRDRGSSYGETSTVSEGWSHERH